MNQPPLSPDDPRLTLYALHEMEPVEREGFEKLLQQDTAARQTVEEIRAMAATVTTALASEPEPVAVREDYRPPGKILRFPRFYFMVSGLAAACFALFFVTWQQNRPSHETRTYLELDLSKVVSAEGSAKPEESQDGKERAVNVETRQPSADASTASSVAPVITLDLPGSPPAQQGVASIALSARSTGAILPEAKPAASAPAGNRTDPVAGDRQISPLVGHSLAQAEIEAKHASERRRHAPGQEFAGAMGKTSNAMGDFNTEAYGYRKENNYLRVADHPLSTFAIDVDTASYANVRRFLTQGQRPPADAVRIEELVNYFPYRYPPPAGDGPFAAHLEVAAAPWAPEHRLVRIGLKGREVSDSPDSTGSPQARPAANLVFLLDVSGSMNHPNKLPLVKQSLRLLVDRLRADDRVAIAVYAGASGLVLPSTLAGRKADILEAIDRLEASGSTNGAMGIQLAYDLAKANFVPGGINRVILATDGDFNVGVTSEGELVRLIGEKAKSGVFLSVLGFGRGNLKDRTLEQLADHGNGNYAYIDTLAEAKKTLVEQAGGTLLTIAKDVKIQVEFNPAQVQAYRLIGYENRLLAKEDFNNDKVDAGEIGAGHTVTALYEVVPAGAVQSGETPGVDTLKYQVVENRESKIQNPKSGELLTVKIRYKEPAGDVSRKLEFPLRDTGTRFADASADFKFAAAVAGFGMALRDSPHKGSLTLAAVADWGRAGLGDDPGGYRHEFLGLVQLAEAQQ